MPARKKPVILMFVILFAWGCKPQKINEHELYQYLNEASNGLIIIKERSHIKVKAMYYPYQLMVSREIENEPMYRRKDSLIALYTSQYKKYMYISLSISETDIDGKDQYPNRYLADAIRRRGGLNGEDMNLFIRNDEGEEIPAIYSICNDTYATAPEIEVLFAFEREKIKKSFTFHVEGLYDHVGDEFSFSEKNINTIPAINYN